MSSEYRVNKSTGQVVKDDGTGWKPVASVRNKTTGAILIDEGNGWQPVPGAQRALQADRGMTMASERANQAMASGQRIAPDDLTKLGQPDFSSAAMARLPAPTMSVAELDAFDAQKRLEKERLRVPDNDFKERSIIALNVPTVGFGPQAAAGAKTLGALAATPFIEGDIIDREGVSGAMSSFLDDARVHQRRAREERPLESFGTEIALGVLQGKTLIDNFGRKVFPKTNTASNLGRVVGTGTGYGLAYGFGQSESGTLQGALGDAAFGGALGAGFGLGFKAAEPALTAGYRSAKTGAATISDALSDLLGKAGGARDKVAQEVALAAVRRSMERSGMTFDQIMELVKRYEGKPAVLAEVIGQDAVNSLTALTRRPGSTPQKAQDLIEERFYGRPDRMKGDVEDATGIPIGQLDDTLDAQLIERQQAAKPIYDALYKQYSTIKSFGESLKRINRLARTPAMQKHLKLAEEAVKTQAAIRQVPVSKMSKMEYWDLVKRSLDDEINSAVAKGEARTKVGASVADLTQLKSAITGEFDRLTGGAYAAAREAGGEAPRLRAAAAAGQKALQARNPRDVAKTVAATLSQDLPALRAGMVDDLGTRIDKGMTPGRVRVPDVAGKLRAGLGDESANKLINRLDAEATLSETGSRWAPRLNSVTGTVMESGATQMGDDLVNAGMNLATGNKVGLARQAINFMRQRGFSQRQIDAIGDLLLSSPEEGLRRLRMLAPDGAPTNALAPATGAADGALNSTAQGGTPAANALAQKPGKLGTRTADAAAIATLGLQGGTAEADTGGASAELKTANEQAATATKRVADVDANITRLQDELDLLERAYAQDPTVDAKRVQLILEARDFDLGPKGADGRIGPDTRIAIKGNIAKIEGEIAKQQTERSKAEQAEATALQTVKQAERQAKLNAMQAKNEPNMVLDVASKVAMLAGLAGGVYWAKRGRGGAVAKSAPAAKAAAARANSLLNSKPLTTAKSGPNSLNQRAANINEFWKQGGAGRKVPFQVDASGKWTDKPGAMEPAQLFNPKWYQQYRNDDVLYMVTAAVDVGGSRAGINYLNDEIKKVETEYKTYEAEDDYASMERKLDEKTRLEGLRTMLQITEKVGGGYLLGRAVGSPLMPYAKVNASVKAAEAQRASLLQKMNPPQKPSPASNNQGQGNP
jgi:hypothetical protein